MKKFIVGHFSVENLKMLGAVLMFHLPAVFFYMFLQPFGAKAYTELSFGEIIWLHVLSLISMIITGVLFIIGVVLYVYRQEIAKKKAKKDSNAGL